MASAEDEARSLEAKLEELKATIEDVIEASGIEDIRRAVREVFAQRLKVDDERERRESARHEKLKQDGVLCDVVPLPEKPQRDCIIYTGVLPALTKKPIEPEKPPCLRDGKPRENWDEEDIAAANKFESEMSKCEKALCDLIERSRELGFPNDVYDEDSCLDVQCWIPTELDPDEDPQNDELLPIPKREFTDAEKITVVAAVHDALCAGCEKVAPWGLVPNGLGPKFWQPDADRDDNRASMAYRHLFESAMDLKISDLRVIERWLKKPPFSVDDVGGTGDTTTETNQERESHDTEEIPASIDAEVQIASHQQTKDVLDREFQDGLRQIDQGLINLFPALYSSDYEMKAAVDKFLDCVTVGPDGPMFVAGKLLSTDWRELAADPNNPEKMGTYQPAMAYKDDVLTEVAWGALWNTVSALMDIASGRLSRKRVREAREALGEYLVTRGYEEPNCETPPPVPVRGFLGGTELADAMGIHPTRRDAFFKKLERVRKNWELDIFREASDPRPNDWKYEYRVDSLELQQLAKIYRNPKLA